MGKHEKGIVGVSNDLCRTLLETEQSVGIHSDLLIRKIKMPTAEQLSNSLGLWSKQEADLEILSHDYTGARICRHYPIIKGKEVLYNRQKFPN